MWLFLSSCFEIRLGHQVTGEESTVRACPSPATPDRSIESGIKHNWKATCLELCAKKNLYFKWLYFINHVFLLRRNLSFPRFYYRNRAQKCYNVYFQKCIVTVHSDNNDFWWGRQKLKITFKYFYWFSIWINITKNNTFLILKEETWNSMLWHFRLNNQTIISFH